MKKSQYKMRYLLWRRIVDISLKARFWLKMRNLTKYFYGRSLHLGKNVLVYPSNFLSAPISIGDYTGMGQNNVFKGGEEVIIGKYCAFGDNIKVISSNHNMGRANMNSRLQRDLFGDNLNASKGRVVIGNNIWVGDNAIILPGVNVGDGAIIGAGAIVTKDVPPFSIVAGNPAVVKRMRFSDDVIKELLRIRWWDWDMETMKKNKEFFMKDLTAADISFLRKIK